MRESHTKNYGSIVPLTLRERCESLANELVGTNYSVVDMLESFAREMFEAGRQSIWDKATSGGWAHTGACMPGCTCTLALAAKGNTE